MSLSKEISKLLDWIETVPPRAEVETRLNRIIDGLKLSKPEADGLKALVKGRLSEFDESLDPLVDAAAARLAQDEAFNLKSFNEGPTYSAECQTCRTKFTVTPGSRSVGAGINLKAWHCVFCGNTYLRFRED